MKGDTSGQAGKRRGSGRPQGEQQVGSGVGYLLVLCRVPHAGQTLSKHRCKLNSAHTLTYDRTAPSLASIYIICWQVAPGRQGWTDVLHPMIAALPPHPHPHPHP